MADSLWIGSAESAPVAPSRSRKAPGINREFAVNALGRYGDALFPVLPGAGVGVSGVFVRDCELVTADEQPKPPRCTCRAADGAPHAGDCALVLTPADLSYGGDRDESPEEYAAAMQRLASSRPDPLTPKAREHFEALIVEQAAAAILRRTEPIRWVDSDGARNAFADTRVEPAFVESFRTGPYQWHEPAELAAHVGACATMTGIVERTLRGLHAGWRTAGDKRHGYIDPESFWGVRYDASCSLRLQLAGLIDEVRRRSNANSPTENP